jgi:acyl carrier protein
MEIKDFIENFADIFDDVDAAELTPDTKFRELDEWSSLMALSIIAMADDEYDVEIKGDDIRNSTTIADLFEIVKKKA